MEVVTDAVPSPARSGDCASAKNDQQGEPGITIPVSPHESKTRERVLMNSAPSPVQQSLIPGQMVTQIEAAATEPQEPTVGIPSSQLKIEQASGEKHQYTGSASPKIHRDDCRGPKLFQSGTKHSQAKKSSKSRRFPPINISNSNNVIVGSVTNLTFNQNQTEQTEGFGKIPKEKRIQLTRLFNSRSTVDSRDISIVSEKLDKTGLRKLSGHLGLSEAEINIKEQEYESEGPKEICYQILEFWRLSCCGGENQSAMLSRLCDKLVEVWNHGGEEALDGLYIEHFGAFESSPHLTS